MVLAPGAIIFSDNTVQETAYTGKIGSTSGLLVVTTTDGALTSSSGINSSLISNFNSSVSGILPVKNIIAGSNITVSSNSGTYTIGGSSSTSVIEYNNVLNFPSSGVGSTIYISTDTGRIYRWASSVYQELGPVSYAPIGSDSRWNLFLPPAPMGLSVTAGNTQATLSWNAPTVSTQTPITDYTVQYSSNSGSSWTTFTRSVSTSTTETVTGLTNGQGYIFRVAAVNGIGTGAYSAVSSVVTPVAFSPSSIGGLQLWLDASDASTLYDATTGGSLVAANGAVARWEDKSGNSRHLTQSISGNRPLRRTNRQNGLDVIELDGSNDCFASTMSIAASNWTFFFAVKPTTVSGDLGGRYFFDSETGRLIIAQIDNNGDGPYSSVAFFSGEWNEISAPTTPSQVLAFVLDDNGTNGKVFRNGTQIGIAASYSQRAIGGQIRFFGDFTSTGAFADGLVYEVLLYNSALSDADRSAVESYLMSKWGIA
jgi:hypothetical protein